jgi:hypothetical protein
MKRCVFALLALIPPRACQSGFTPQPRAAMFPATGQQYLRSASHWDLVAQPEANNLSEFLRDANLIAIRPTDNSARPFEQACHQMLTTHLPRQCVQIGLTPAGATHHV